MKTPWEIKIGNFAQYLAVGSFIIGTILFALKFALKHDFQDYIIVIGLYYVIVAFFINFIYLIIMISSLFFTEHYHLHIIKKCLFMLTNIPIVILYYFIIISQLNLYGTS